MNKLVNNEKIEHEGIVEKTDNNSVTVKIVSVSACSGCHAEGYCSLSDRKDKRVIIPGMFHVAPGDNVTVIMERSMGYRALFLGYILPMILFIGALILFTALSAGEIASGLGALALLIPYYLALRFFRKRIDNKFTFTLKV
jgi:positive regulator of sigma E activity